MMHQSNQLQRRSFADNQRVSVADALRAQARYRNDQYSINIATGYFNLGGFTCIADILEAAPSVRILIGAEPEQGTVPDRLIADRYDHIRAVERVKDSILVDRDELPFNAASDAEIERLKTFLARPTTEVRIYRERFLHGKAYLFGTEEAVIAGSANFTHAGLNRNLELDLGQYQPDDVRRVSAWYDDLWNKAEPFDLAGIFTRRLELYEPHKIYLRMLYAQYSSELIQDEETRRVFGGIQLAEFQRLGSQRAVRILDKWNGAILADGVGLGKTVVAGDVIRTFVADRGLRVLVVCPASLRKMWRDYLAKENLPGEVISYTQLSREPQITGGDGERLPLPPQQYRLIVADEAHALRNAGISAYDAMRSLLTKSPDAKLLLMTATPVNNSLWDLYNEVMLFAKTDNAFESVGIPNLREHVKAVTRLDPEDIDPAHMFAVLDAISVRRTRQFIKTHFPNAEINGQRIVFPKIEPHTERYDLDAIVPGLFEEIADIIGNRLHMTRYRTQTYLLDEAPNVTRQEFLSGLLRSQILKRFESSAYAFRKTLGKMLAAHQQCLTLIENDGIVPLSAVSAETLQDPDLVEELLEYEEARPVGEFDANQLLGDLREDIALLESMRAKIAGITPDNDPKLEQLVQILRDAATKPTCDKRKTLVFTSFVDTVKYIREHLEVVAQADPVLANMVARAGYVLGNQETDVDERADLACGFTPKSMRPDDPEAPDSYDLLVTTDVLAEGQNLQQCGRIVNFDLPWNPMRVVQRNGRVDRIGSPHDIVDMHCFMPDTQLDEYLKLEERLRRKIAQANAGVGVEGVVIPGMDTKSHIFADIDKELDRTSKYIHGLANQDMEVIKTLEEDDTYSGEQFREELRSTLMSEAGEDLVRLPWGIGSGHDEGSILAVVFLAKAGRRHYFRKVALPPHGIESDLLDSLKAARCKFNAERVLPDALRTAIYDAWERVRHSLFAGIQEQRDPAKTQNALPKAQRDAIDLLQCSAHEAAPDAVEALTAVWPVDVEKSLRQILRDEDANDEDKVGVIVQLVRSRGLKPQIQEEVPNIAEADIKLICYQVISPQETSRI